MFESCLQDQVHCLHYLSCRSSSWGTSQLSVNPQGHPLCGMPPFQRRNHGSTLAAFGVSPFPGSYNEHAGGSWDALIEFTHRVCRSRSICPASMFVGPWQLRPSALSAIVSNPSKHQRLKCSQTSRSLSRSASAKQDSLILCRLSRPWPRNLSQSTSDEDASQRQHRQRR